MTEILKRENLGSDNHPLSHKPGLSIYDIAPEDALRMRLDYVSQMGWLDPNRTSDRDAYDEYDRRTAHIVHRDGDGRLVASMRLTPVGDFEDSISFSEMIGGDVPYQESVRRQLAAHAGQAPGGAQVWDLTRLVHDTTREGRGSVLPAFLEMFGAGLAATAPKGNSDKDTWWAFITTGKIRQTLERCGIELHDLGRSSGDDEKSTSYCCLVKPVEAFGKLSENPRRRLAYKMVQSGFDAAVSIE